VFLGCRTTGECGGAYDAGAIRIDNTSSAALTLTDAYVDINGCHFAPWVVLLPATANPGESFVLTQTGLLGPPQPAPCDGQVDPSLQPITNFDTSEGPFPLDTPGSVVCAPGQSAPVITLVFDDGTTLTVTDSAKVLSTGGTDRAFCEGVAEGTAWTAVPTTDIVRTP
jgi:hypothetical protein